VAAGEQHGAPAAGCDRELWQCRKARSPRRLDWPTQAEEGWLSAAGVAAQACRHLRPLRSPCGWRSRPSSASPWQIAGIEDGARGGEAGPALAGRSSTAFASSSRLCSWGPAGCETALEPFLGRFRASFWLRKSRTRKGGGTPRCMPRVSRIGLAPCAVTGEQN